MKKRFWLVLLAVVSALCLCIGLVACGNLNGNSENSGNDGSDSSGNGTGDETVVEGENPNLNPNPEFSTNVVDGLFFKLNDDGKSYYVNDGGFFGTVLSIPSKFNGLPVTSIKAKAFSYKEMQEIIIPDSVISIGEGAFKNCSGLTKITIGSGLTSIGSNVFNRIRDTAKNQKILLKQSLSRA